jgi:tetratricopeptide (TPR) repeat protein
MNFKSIKIGISVLALALTTMTVQAQQTEHSNQNVRLGQKALLDGDFKTAVTYLEKALPSEEKDPSVQYMLGYSQFQSGEFKKAATTFGKVIALNPSDANAYYYKAKSNISLLESPTSKFSDGQRVEMLQLVIADYNKAISLNKSDMKLYQNRGIAYRDLGIVRSTEGTNTFNKVAAIDAYNKSIADFEKVLTFDANRKDIQAETHKVKVYRDLLK